MLAKALRITAIAIWLPLAIGLINVESAHSIERADDVPASMLAQDGAPRGAVPPSTAIERIAPQVTNGSLADASVTLNVTVEQVTNLGAYEALLDFDPGLLTFLSASNAPFLGSTGRSVSCLPPILTPNVGGSGLTRLSFACNSSGTGPGSSGAGVLTNVQFRPLSPGVATLDLTPSLADPLGNDINAVAFDGTVAIAVGPTSTPTATATPCPGGSCPTSTPSPTATATPVVVCQAPGIAVCFHPQDQVVGGGPITVDLVVSQVANLGAFGFTVSFDSGVIFVHFVLRKHLSRING